MKLSELKRIVDECSNSNPDLEVVVMIYDYNMGCNAYDKVSSAGKGFDWEDKLFILSPKDTLYVDQSDEE